MSSNCLSAHSVRREIVKHIALVTRRPQAAATITIGQLLTVFAQIMSTIGAALSAKDAADA